MSGEITIEFEELPLVVDLGFHAGLVNGTATIRYHDDGQWFLQGVTLDGSRALSTDEKTAAEKRLGYVVRPYVEKPVTIDRESYQWLFDAISEQLERGTYQGHVEDAVQKALEDDRAEGTAPRQRSDREEHSTLNRAQQGV